MARALTPRALAVVIFPSHDKQLGKASFRVRGEKEHCYSDSPKIERGVLNASTSTSFGLCGTLLTTSGI
jgi:hypothetical protein